MNRLAPAQAQPRHRAHLVRAVEAGDAPLEVLAVQGMRSERDRLLRAWRAAGWSAARIAGHTHSTTATVTRLLEQLDVAERQVRVDALIRAFTRTSAVP